MAALTFNTAVARGFEAGESNITISADSGRYFDESYVAIGIGYDYFVTHGSQVGVKRIDDCRVNVTFTS